MTDSVAHTKEPWLAVEVGKKEQFNLYWQIVSEKDGVIIAKIYKYQDGESDARLIVACVNALAGIENVEAIEELIAGCKALMEWQMALAMEDARHKQRPVEFRSFLTPSCELIYDALSKLDGE